LGNSFLLKPSTTTTESTRPLLIWSEILLEAQARLKPHFDPITLKGRMIAPGGASVAASLGIYEMDFEVYSLAPKVYTVQGVLTLNLVVNEKKNLTLEMAQAMDLAVFALEKDKTMGGLLEEISLKEIQQEVEASGVKALGYVKMEFGVFYKTRGM
jgi:hypothetical protein